MAFWGAGTGVCGGSVGLGGGRLGGYTRRFARWGLVLAGGIGAFLAGGSMGQLFGV